MYIFYIAVCITFNIPVTLCWHTLHKESHKFSCFLKKLNSLNCRKYRPEIEKFIAVLMERDAQDEERIPDLNLKVNSLGQVNCTQV